MECEDVIRRRWTGMLAGVDKRIASVRGLDNGEKLKFAQHQKADLFRFFASGYPYGTGHVVRVAVATVES